MTPVESEKDPVAKFAICTDTAEVKGLFESIRTSIPTFLSHVRCDRHFEHLI